MPPKIFLNQEMWRTQGRLSEDDNENLTKPFSMEEIEKALGEMKTNTAPGLDGLPVSFYRVLATTKQPDQRDDGSVV